MLCLECDWHWSYEDDGIRCPFCTGAIGVVTDDDPLDAREAVAEATSE